jgi:hypothetical protein
MNLEGTAREVQPQQGNASWASTSGKYSIHISSLDNDNLKICLVL